MDSLDKLTFSVVIPAYNRENVILRAINSVLAQTFQNFEIIVVNDGSSDNTLERLSSVQDKRLHIISYEVNRGQIYATNTGIEHARGQYVAFLDSDDEWLPDMLQSQYNKYQTDKELGCVYTFADAIDLEGVRHPWPRWHLEGFIYKEVLEQGFLCGMPMLGVKRTCLDIICPIDGTFTIGGRDDEICLQLAKRFKIGLIKESLVLVHNDEKNRITTQNNVNIGWIFLFIKHQNDIIQFCGTETLAKHFSMCAKLFFCKDGKYNTIFATQSAALAFGTNGTFTNFLALLIMKLPIKTRRKKQLLKRFIPSWSDKNVS